jgi:aspartate/methionine/tyrosine aminotransferase
MTGWRLGYVGVPQSAVNAIDATVQNTVGCAPAFVQRASVVAMREVDAEVAAMVAEYQRRRDELCGALASVPGFRLSTPQGALYAWVDISRAGRGDGGEIARLLLEELGIAVAPGHAFGAEYTDFVRFAYGCGSDAISAACAALAKWSLTAPQPLAST